MQLYSLVIYLTTTLSFSAFQLLRMICIIITNNKDGAFTKPQKPEKVSAFNMVVPQTLMRGQNRADWLKPT